MLQVIQGDVFEICVELQDVELKFVDKVVFASKDLCVEREAEECNGNYRVKFDGRETSKFPFGFARYDITVFLIDGERITARYNTKIEVLKKTNVGNFECRS